MSKTVIVRESMEVDGITTSDRVEVEAGLIQIVDEAVPKASADLLASLSFLKDNLQAIHLTCDSEITIETNDGGSPDDTLTVGPDSPLHWYRGSAHANPFTADVTAFYLTEPDVAATTLQGLIAVDPT